MRRRTPRPPREVENGWPVADQVSGCIDGLIRELVLQLLPSLMGRSTISLTARADGARPGQGNVATERRSVQLKICNAFFLARHSSL